MHSRFSLYIVITVSIISLQRLNAQCDSIAEDIWEIVRTKDFTKLDSLFLPAKEWGWVKSVPGNAKLLQDVIEIRESKKKNFLSSVKIVRHEMQRKNIDVSQMKIRRCRILHDTLIIKLKGGGKKYKLRTLVTKRDKYYVVLPLNLDLSKIGSIKMEKVGGP